MSEASKKPPRYKPYRPKLSERCLCGSGLKFGDCCRGRLPAFEIGKAYSRAIDKRDWESALLRCRADITQYSIWHRSHAAPALAGGAEVSRLLKVDVEALAAYVERLLGLYVATGRKGEWLTVCDAIRTNIAHSKWRKKVGYFRALSYLSPPPNRSMALAELQRLGPLSDDEDDVELLQLSIDLTLDDRSFTDRLSLLQRAIEVSGKRADRMQYGCAIAIQYMLIGDQTKASEELSGLVEVVRGSSDGEPLTHYEQRLFAGILEYLAFLKNDVALVEEAIGLLHTLLQDDSWTDRGQVRLHRQIGECEKYARRWSEAEASFRKAAELGGEPLDQVHIAQALLGQNRLPEAGEVFDRIDGDRLDGPEREDFAFACADIALATGDPSRLLKAKAVLSALSTKEPYFNERRLKMLLELTEKLAGKPAKSKANRIGSAVSAASSVIMLQPNVMGFGININAFIDLLTKKKPPDSE